jgi:hypothetical protein
MRSFFHTMLIVEFPTIKQEKKMTDFNFGELPGELPEDRAARYKRVSDWVEKRKEVRNLHDELKDMKPMTPEEKLAQYNQCEFWGKNGPTGDEVFDEYRWGDVLIEISHMYGEPIYDEDVAEEGAYEAININMSTEMFESLLNGKEFDVVARKWCEEEKCTRVAIVMLTKDTRRVRVSKKDNQLVFTYEGFAGGEEQRFQISESLRAWAAEHHPLLGDFTMPIKDDADANMNEMQINQISS